MRFQLYVDDVYLFHLDWAQIGLTVLDKDSSAGNITIMSTTDTRLPPVTFQ